MKDVEMINGAFVDLEEEARELMKQEETKRPEADMTQSRAKIFLNHDSRIVCDDYISRSTYDSDFTKKDQNDLVPAPPTVDWFNLYMNKNFNFRSDPAKLSQIRQAICKHRLLSPSLQVYDMVDLNCVNTKILMGK